jgi:GR25 family glycosyltransferase involved in LPS biosynthesis
VSAFHALVINLADRKDRRDAIIERLYHLKIEHEIINAVSITDIPSSTSQLLTPTAEAVWQSHLKCLKIAASSQKPILILEDDALPKLNSKSIEILSKIMISSNLDFIQLGFLTHNFTEAISIYTRNFYNLFTRKNYLSFMFKFFGFKEVSRASMQVWRALLPISFVVNDIRHGAHFYLVNPAFAERVLKLNDPAFLAADDFYVAISKMKTFKMIRLKRSKCSQDNSVSSFTKRYVLD